VIGPGFGRTGTMSLKYALERLGFGPCHHMEEVFAHPEQVPHWQAVVAGRPVVWDDVFAGYRSQVDWPGAHPWARTRHRLSAVQGDPIRAAGGGLVDQLLGHNRRPV
jgi:Sulfotransferase domain